MHGEDDGINRKERDVSQGMCLIEVLWKLGTQGGMVTEDEGDRWSNAGEFAS